MKLRPRPVAALFFTAALALTATACSNTPSQMTVKGTVTVVDNPVAGEDPPVSDGSQVTVTDPAEKVIGFTTLNGDADQGATFTLTFGFTVKVPEGEASYGIAVSGLNGTTRYTEKQMKAGPAICAGDACQ